VLTEMLEEEVDEIVGPKGDRNPDRASVEGSAAGRAQEDA
jgi:hypothetical protein